jgi:uncharacterized protein (TIGR03663 family)
MSTLEIPVVTPEPRPGPEAPSRPVGRSISRPALTVEQLIYVAIGLVSLLLHVWQLGNRALHHDETLHAAYSWYLYVGRPYIHDPLLHGPFLYFFGALMYTLFGDNDFTARLGVAIFGTLLTLSPWLLRRQIGRGAALCAAIYLLVSPSVLYMGRFVRHDMYSLLFEMLVVVGLLRYWAERRPRWLYLAAAAFGLMFVNQETSYLFAVIWAVPIIAALLWRVWRPGLLVLGAAGVLVAALVFVLPGKAQIDGENNAARDQQTGQMLVSEPGPLFGWGPLETADNNYALRIRNRSDDDGGRSLPANASAYFGELGKFFGHPAVLLAMGTLLGVLALLVWVGWRRRGRDGLTAWERARADHDDSVLNAFASLLASRRLLVAALIFLAIYVAFFTAFFRNWLGVVTGTTGSLLYWLAQHDVKRGGQPRYYYLVLLTVYEPLLLAWGAAALALIGRGLWKARGAAVRTPLPSDGDDSAAHGSENGVSVVHSPPTTQRSALAVPLLLLWWSLATVAIYSWAGEKMPWLLIHLVLPLTLLGAWACARSLGWALNALAPHQARTQEGGAPFILANPLPLGMFTAVMAVIGVLAFLFLGVTSNQEGGGAFPGPLLLVAILALLVVLLTAAAGLRYSWRWGAGALALGATLLLGVYTVRNTVRLSFISGDTPREMLIYTQTSPDVMRVVRGLERASRVRYNNLSMPVIYDNETVWSWYMRRFTAATDSGQNLSQRPGPEVQAVLMLQENIDRNPANLEMLEGFRVQRLPLRWWLPEDEVYRLSSDWRTAPPEQLSLLGRVLRAPFSSTTVADLWQYLMYRNTKAPLGSSDFVIAVRPELADEIGLGTGASRDR